MGAPAPGAGPGFYRATRDPATASATPCRFQLRVGARRVGTAYATGALQHATEPLLDSTSCCVTMRTRSAGRWSPTPTRSSARADAAFRRHASTASSSSPIRAGVGPFHDLALGGRHLHHLVFGIGGLLGTGYLWLLLVGTDVQKGRRPYRATAAAYGLASALTLDELALWLNLEDVYWARQGRESVDAVAVFGSMLSVGLWGGPFLRGLARELRKLR
jgi:hypothetical protein